MSPQPCPTRALSLLMVGTLLAADESWIGETVLQQAFSDTDVFPFVAEDSGDAALLFKLAPGSYTARTSDAGAAGVVLGEVYAMA